MALWGAGVGSRSVHVTVSPGSTVTDAGEKPWFTPTIETDLSLARADPAPSQPLPTTTTKAVATTIPPNRRTRRW
jgi:hypothetical protein